MFKIWSCCLLIVMNIYCAVRGEEVLYAVNLGGEAHEDSNGILYQKDLSSHRTYTFYDNIAGASAQDQPIYQTIFYGSKLMLDLPITGNGDYKLILKFAEDVLAEDVNRIMNVFINQVHHVVDKLNVYTYVGLFAAYDRIIQFSVLNNKLTWNNKVSTIINNQIKFELTGTNGYDAQISAVAWTKTPSIHNTQPILPASESQEDVASQKNDNIINILQSLKNIEGLLEKLVSSPNRKILSDNEL
jgi:hypothetical protein